MRNGPFRHLPTWTVAAASCFAFVAVGSRPVAAQNPSHGPLTYEEGAPLHQVAYTAMMEDAAVTPRGAFATDLWLGLSNIFEQDSADTHMLFMDLERLVSTLTVRWGATDRLELGGRVMLETTGGGALDGVILDWHELWGFGNANRDRFPEGQYFQYLEDGDGNVLIDIPSQTLGLEDVRLFSKVQLVSDPDRGRALSLKGELRLPAGSNRATEERADGALSLLGRTGFGSWYLHGMLGAATQRASAELEPVLRGGSTFLTLAAERSFGSFSALVQYQVQSPVLESFDHRELDRAASNFILGLSGAWSGWRWDASFQEDLPSDTPAIDFTIGLRLSRSW